LAHDLSVELNINLRVVLLPHVECAKAVLSKQALEQRAQRVQRRQRLAGRRCARRKLVDARRS
jgi:hypothetical protein